MNDDALARLRETFDSLQPTRRMREDMATAAARISDGPRRQLQESLDRFHETTRSMHMPAVEAGLHLAATVKTSPDFSALAMPPVIDIAQIVKTYDFTSRWKEQLARTAELTRQVLAQWEEAQGEALSLLAPRGWVLSPTMEGVDVHQLLRVAHEQGVDAAEAMLLEAYTDDACRSALVSCCDHPAFEPWRAHIEQALDAHGRGLFLLSTPVWLIVMEGVIKAQFDVNQVYSHLTSPKRRESFREGLPTAGSPALRDGLVDALHHVGESRRDAPEDGSLRRHTTMHGNDPAYGTHANSVKGIVLLEALHYLLAQAETELRRAA